MTCEPIPLWRKDGLLRPVRGWLLLSIALQALSSALVLAPLLGLSILAETLIGEGAVAHAHAWDIIAVSALCLGGGLVTRGLVDLITHLADNTLALQLRLQLADKIRRAPIEWLAARGGGGINQVVQNDVASLHHLVAHAFVDLTGAIITPIVGYAYLFWLDWRLALVTLAPLPMFAFFYSRVFFATGGKEMADYGKALERVNETVVEFVQGLPAIKLYGQQGKAFHAYARAIEEFQAFFLSWARPLIVPETLAFIAISPITLLAIICCTGTIFTGFGWIDGTQLIPFAALGVGISIPITRLAHGAQSLQTARAAQVRLSEALTMPQHSDPPGPVGLVDGRIEFKNVSLSFDGTRQVLENISFSLNPGTVTAIVGPSGAGKSTLAELALRFRNPGSGIITLGGTRLDEIDAATLYGTLGFVFQNVQLLRLSIRDNIALGAPEADMVDIVAAAKAANIHDRILALPRQYDSVFGEDAQLSGGEIQRISIARALLLDPPVLVLDEATSNADVDSEHAIQTALRNLGAGRTLLVIAHDLASIVNADNIIVLVEGRIAERGTHRELLALNGHYARMWRAQNPVREYA